jgi:hypothetical protein
VLTGAVSLTAQDKFEEAIVAFETENYRKEENEI